MKILLIVNGFGLGNSFRCDKIVDRFHTALAHQQHEIHILTSGNGALFFRNKTNVDKIHFQNQLQYAKKLGLFRNLWAWVKQVPLFLQNVKVQKSLMAKERYDLILSDSDYSFIFWKKRSHRVFGINNSAVVLSAKPQLSKILNVQYLCEKIERLIFARFSTGVICPTFNILERDEKTLQLPFCFQLEPQPQVARDLSKNIVVIHGGSHFAQIDRSLDFKLLEQKGIRLHLLGNLGIDAASKFTSHQFVFDSRKHDLIHNADIVIANAGFGSLVEILSLARAGLVIPLQGHYEQWANAHLAAQISRRIQIVDLKNLNEKIEKLLQDPAKDSRAKNDVILPLETDIQREFSIFFQKVFSLVSIRAETAQTFHKSNCETRFLPDLER